MLNDLASWPALSWPAHVAAHYMRQLWRDLPGPAWLKIILFAACIAIPGPLDELALVALPAASRAWRKRRAAALRN